MQNLTFTVGPIAVPSFGVVNRPAPSPTENGYVVGMSAEIVDAAGRVQGRDKVI